MTGVCLIGQIVNNCVTNNAKLPLSAAQGKVLMDLYTVLNNDFEKYYSLSDAIQIPSNADLDDYTNFGNYVSSAASISSTLQNCPALNAGFVLHVERVTGSRDGTFLKQRIVYNEAKSLEYWRVKTGEESWGTWVSPITNADHNPQPITNSYGVLITLIKFGSDDHPKGIKIQGYLNKALSAGKEYTIATDSALKSSINWYHNVFTGVKGKGTICYMNIDTNGNLKFTPHTNIESGAGMNVMECYI